MSLLQRKPIGFALIIAMTAGFVGMTCAQVSRAAAGPVVQAGSVTSKAPLPATAPEGWIIFDDNTYTPVIDAVSRHLDAARKAFDANDNKKAAAEMRAVAAELNRQAALADRQNRWLEKGDQALLAADAKIANDTHTRMMASAMNVSSAAAAIESGKITTKTELDKAIDKAARADMDRRWMMSDVTAWYPASEEPQAHFADAILKYGKKDFKSAAVEIRMASSYLRLEAGRASGDARQALDSSLEQLGTLADSVEKNAIKDRNAMAIAFARANYALALAHRAKAGESWAHKEFDKTGYELRAVARALDGAAGWIYGEVTTSVPAGAAEARVIGDKLTSGAAWTRDEVAKTFETLRNSIDALGQKVGSNNKASSIDIGG